MKSVRSQAEILARFLEVAPDDIFGFAREVLVASLDAEHGGPSGGPEDIDKGARSYLEFAYGKASEHRGISASRSVEKLSTFAWLAGRDDVVEAMDAAGYENFGAPKLAVFATLMGFPACEADEFKRMAQGLPCVPGCESGCGR